MHRNLVLELQYCTKLYRVKFAQLPLLGCVNAEVNQHLQTVAAALDDNMDGFASTGVHHSEFHRRNLDNYMHR